MKFILLRTKGIFMIELILAEDIIGIAKTGDTVVLKDDNTFEIQKAETFDDLGRKSGNFPPTKDEEEKLIQYANKLKEQKETKKEYDPRIEKYLPNDKAKAWSILEKFNKSNPHFDASEVLKEFINKVALCPEVTDKFEKIMEGWMRDGEADVSVLEKIINSCKTEGGNKIIEGDDEVVKEHTCSICDVEKGDKKISYYMQRMSDGEMTEQDRKDYNKLLQDELTKAERSPEQLREMAEARKRQQDDDEVKIKPIGKSKDSILNDPEIQDSIVRAEKNKGKNHFLDTMRELENSRKPKVNKSAEIIEAITKESIRERTNREAKDKKETPDEARRREKRYQQDFFRDM
jgi:hypothetical protein